MNWLLLAQDPATAAAILDSAVKAGMNAAPSRSDGYWLAAITVLSSFGTLSLLIWILGKSVPALFKDFLGKLDTLATVVTKLDSSIEKMGQKFEELVEQLSRQTNR